MNVQESMKKQNDLAMILSRHILAKHSNSVFSPASVNATLTMIASGPGGNEISRGIRFFFRSLSMELINYVFSVISSFILADGTNLGGPTIKVANGVWIQQTLPIDPSMKNLFHDFFKADFNLVDIISKFEEVRKEVNAWAEHHTNGLIKDILPPDSVYSLTQQIYANALYFKGAWKVKFDESRTRDHEFYLLDGTSVSVPFMTSDNDQFLAAYNGFKVLRLPFRQGHDNTRNFSMSFYLPDKKDGLDSLREKIASNPGFLEWHIPRSSVVVGDVRLPKFKIEFGFMPSKIFKGPVLPGLDIYQKACVEIDEEGEGAAAPAPAMSFGCNFVANHPFLFFISEDTTLTFLFVGQIFDPSKSS